MALGRFAIDMRLLPFAGTLESGLDKVRAALSTSAQRELLTRIAKDHAVVVVEHDMAFVRALGCKVTCLHEGSVLAEGTIDQVSSNERVIEVYLGR